jgi:hypothetical protein
MKAGDKATDSKDSTTIEAIAGLRLAELPSPQLATRPLGSLACGCEGILDALAVGERMPELSWRERRADARRQPTGEAPHDRVARTQAPWVICSAAGSALMEVEGRRCDPAQSAAPTAPPKYALPHELSILIAHASADGIAAAQHFRAPRRCD